jgi:hypothetical protein
LHNHSSGGSGRDAKDMAKGPPLGVEGIYCSPRTCEG